MEFKDVTDYDFVNNILSKFQLDLDTITRVPIFSEKSSGYDYLFSFPTELDNIRGAYSLAAYKFYEKDEYIGAILFENSTKTNLNKFWGIFDETGELIYYEVGFDNKWLLAYSKDCAVDKLSAFVIGDNSKLIFDVDSDNFIVCATTKTGLELRGKLVHRVRDVEFAWDVIPLPEEEKNRFLQSRTKKAHELKVDGFISLIVGKDEFTNLEKNEEDYLSPGPTTCIYGSKKLDNDSFISDYHKWLSKIYECKVEFKYAVDFTLKSDEEVLVLRNSRDIEILSAIFPEELGYVHPHHLDDSDDGYLCFLNWDLLRKRYKAIFIPRPIDRRWQIPGIIILDKNIINKYIIFEIDKYLDK